MIVKNFFGHYLIYGRQLFCDCSLNDFKNVNDFMVPNNFMVVNDCVFLERNKDFVNKQIM